MLKLTIEDLKDGLRSMMNLVAWKPNNLKLAYNIGRTWKDYKERVNEAEEMERQIYKDFNATESTVPNGIQLNLPEGMTVEERKAFDAKIEEMRKIEVEVWGHPLPFDQLEKANAPLSGDDLSLLSWLIAEPTEEPEEKPKKKGKAAQA